MWTRQGDLYSKVQAWKRELGKIPDETCPLIDKVITALDTPEATEEMEYALKLMEEIREHNAKLRSLGQDWYEYAEQLCEDSDEIIKDLEEEIKSLEEEKQELKYENKELQEQLI